MSKEMDLPQLLNDYCRLLNDNNMWHGSKSYGIDYYYWYQVDNFIIVEDFANISCLLVKDDKWDSRKWFERLYVDDNPLNFDTTHLFYKCCTLNKPYCISQIKGVCLDDFTSWITQHYKYLKKEKDKKIQAKNDQINQLYKEYTK